MMTGTFLERFPTASKIFQTTDQWCDATVKWSHNSQELLRFGENFCHLSLDTVKNLTTWPFTHNPFNPLELPIQMAKQWNTMGYDFWLKEFDRFAHFRKAEQAVTRLFTDFPEAQDWDFAYDNSHVLLDLPSMRVIDISKPGPHALDNYTVVFAPRAGHHSNIAERVAVFMRDQGLTRMAVVEQKCATQIPAEIDGRTYRDNFSGQVNQYKAVLEKLLAQTNKPAHLVAVCQPGPLLLSTLILNPHLGRTYGSAGSPMDTEGEWGYLPEFARLMGRGYINFLLNLLGQSVEDDQPGSGREAYDGAWQVLGFYMLGMDQHVRNLKRFLTDVRSGNKAAAQRQKDFYLWYNTVLHFSGGFIKDTYKEVFVKNALVRNRLKIDGKPVRLSDYPPNVPVWALGGTKDDISPPGQATGHLDYLTHLPKKNKLALICEAGHMGLFRSQRVLESHYTRIVEFIKANSDETQNETKVN